MERGFLGSGEGACPQWLVTEPKRSQTPKRPLFSVPNINGCSIFKTALNRKKYEKSEYVECSNQYENRHCRGNCCHRVLLVDFPSRRALSRDLWRGHQLGSELQSERIWLAG